MTEPLEAMFEQMRQATVYANEHLAEPQEHVTFGHHWARFYDVKNRLVIFGYVEPLASMEAGERELGAGDEEAAYIVADTQRRHDDGYMYGWCYSIVTPDGEIGFTHRADLWPISPEMFEAYKQAGWDIDHVDIPWDVKVSLSTMYAEYQIHTKSIGL